MLRYALWAAAAGALIPLMAVLNARLGRHLGEPLHAPAMLFGVAMMVALMAALATGRVPDLRLLASAEPATLAGGLIVAFYVLTVTLLAPRFGVGNTILFAVSAQLVTSAAIDHFALFGAAARPVGLARVAGLAVMLGGLALAQLGGRAAP